MAKSTEIDAAERIFSSSSMSWKRSLGGADAAEAEIEIGEAGGESIESADADQADKTTEYGGSAKPKGGQKGAQKGAQKGGRARKDRGKDAAAATRSPAAKDRGKDAAAAAAGDADSDSDDERPAKRASRSREASASASTPKRPRLGRAVK